MTTEEKFNAAVEVIRGLPKNGSFQPSHDLQLKFYAFYKQATQGSVAECKVPKPRFWDLVGNAKWDAWMKLGDMSKNEAMEKYVEELVKVVKKCQETATEDQVEECGTLEIVAETDIVEAMSYTDNVAKFVDLLGPLFDTPPPPALQARLNGNGESGEDDIETIQAPNREQPLYTKADRRPEEKLERKPVGGINGHQSNFDSEEDEFSDTYDHIGDEEEEEGGNSPLPHSEPSLLVNAVNEALRSGTDRMLVQDSESQLWAFYADKQGQATDNGANVRGGGDDTQHSKGALPRGLPQGRGYNSRGYRSRREGDGGSEGLPQDRASRGANLHGAAGGSGGQGYGGGGRHRLPLEVSEQLAVAVLRLQQTMDEVVARLEALETLLQHSKSSQVQRWSLFGGVAPHVLLLLLAWPVVFQLGFYILSQRRNRQLR